MAACICRARREAFFAALLMALVPTSARSQETGKLLSPPARITPSLLPVGHHASPVAAAAPREQPAAIVADSRSGLKVSKGAGILPNDQGQVWREYDISAYTARVRDVARPEQAIVDW